MRSRSEAKGNPEIVPGHVGYSPDYKASPEPGTRVPDQTNEQRPDPVFDATDEGRSVEVTIGERTFSPVQYNAFRVGPIKASTMVHKGETIADAILRLHWEMSAAMEKVQERDAEAYLRALRDVGDKARR